MSKIIVNEISNSAGIPSRNRLARGVETMVCVLIHAPLFGAGINGLCGGKLRRGGLRFDFGKPFFFWLLLPSVIKKQFFLGHKKKSNNTFSII
jgi:hypothetical protein